MAGAKLLNPGPVTLTARVRGALAGDNLCHREPEFAALQAELRERLAGVYPEARAAYQAVLLAGSGTAAVEAMVATLVPRDGRALAVVNGAYGERLAAILAAHGRACDVVASDWLAGIDLAAVARRLAAGPRVAPGITHVVAVHHETTSGRLNDVAALGALCRRHDARLLLDAVSSFGGEHLAFEAWNLEAVAATANKCLHGAPGASFVLARTSSLEGARGNAGSFYLDLARQFDAQRRGSSAFTQPVHVCRALREALRELDETGGWPARHARYRALGHRVFRGLAAQGVAPLLAITEPSSAVLTAYRLPAGRSYQALHDDLKAAGFVIYAAQEGCDPATFRVAVMGDLDARDVDALLAACAEHWARARSP